MEPQSSTASASPTSGTPTSTSSRGLCSRRARSASSLPGRLAGGRSAALVETRDAERLTGYRVGGISPFGARRALPVYAERTYLAHDRVALNGGARGLIVELARADLVRALEPTVGDLTGA